MLALYNTMLTRFNRLPAEVEKELDGLEIGFAKAGNTVTKLSTGKRQIHRRGRKQHRRFTTSIDVAGKAVKVSGFVADGANYTMRYCG